MKRFTFGVLTYNQESLVLETLESIKFQKIHYGKDIEVNLYVVDDASKDNTVGIVERWLERNRGYFNAINFDAKSENCGTVINFCELLEIIKSENFKIIAGDDLIGEDNLFLQYTDLGNKKLKTFFRVYLLNGKVLYKKNMLIDFFYNARHNRQGEDTIKKFRKGCYFHTPSTIFSKELFLNSRCKEELEGFRLFEDDPSWYAMLKNQKDIEIEFVDSSIVLYRIHNKSVSNTINPVFQVELDKLHEKYVMDTRGLEHLYWVIRENKKIPKYLRLDKYIDKIVLCKKAIYCYLNKDYYIFKRSIEEKIVREQQFYNNIADIVKREE